MYGDGKILSFEYLKSRQPEYFKKIIWVDHVNTMNINQYESA